MEGLRDRTQPHQHLYQCPDLRSDRPPDGQAVAEQDRAGHESRWRRDWDGRWRLVLFDLPVAHGTARDRLRRNLRRCGFGYLQNSVWISPDPLGEEMASLVSSRASVESLVLLEARPCAGETDEEIVAGAWDFDAINRARAVTSASSASGETTRLISPIS